MKAGESLPARIGFTEPRPGSRFTSSVIIGLTYVNAPAVLAAWEGLTSKETGLALRALIARGVSAMALLCLVACATTTTSPVARQADPAFARKVVTYPTPVPPGTIVIDPGSHFLYLV